MTDTAAKRAAALGVGAPGGSLPIPDGSIDAADRAQLAGVYMPQSGVAPPYQFHFETRFKASQSTEYVSSVATIGGLAGAVQSVVANGEQSVNGGAFTSDPVAIDNGDELRLRLSSSSLPETQVSATATIAGVVGTFVIVTASETPRRARRGNHAVAHKTARRFH